MCRYTSGEGRHESRYSSTGKSQPPYSSLSETVSRAASSSSAMCRCFVHLCFVHRSQVVDAVNQVSLV